MNETGKLALPRVVVIGFNKCATRSLANLFAAAGHRAVHHKIRRGFRSVNIARVMQQNLAAGKKAFEGMDDFTFYGDLIYLSKTECYEGCLHFREIARDYPDTIFLLNLRDREDWIRSRLGHGHGEFVARAMQAHGFRTQAECENFWRETWDRQVREARAFGQEHPGRLVEFNIDDGSADNLVAALPQYRLRAEHWTDRGRSRGRAPQSLMNRLKRFWSHIRPRRY